MPDWYPLLRASRYLGVPPWVLLEQPACWEIWAIIADGAEGEVRDALAQQARDAAAVTS